MNDPHSFLPFQALEQAGEMAKLVGSFLESFTKVVAENASGFLNVNGENARRNAQS